PQPVESTQHDKEERGDGPEAYPVTPEDVVVDGDLDQVRLQQLEERHAGKDQKRQRDQTTVRPRHLPQPRHEARVVGLAENLVVVLSHAHAWASSSSSCWTRQSRAYTPPRASRS